MKRNSSIELYRCSLMFGICLLHSITQCGHNVPWASNILTTCVVGFVFISGWFGVKFSWWKLVKLYGIGIYAALVLFVGLCLRDGGGYVLNAAKAYNQLVHGFWFLHAYAFMMMLAPLVNAALEKGGKTALMTVSPLIAMVWCWGFGLTLPIIGDKLPRTVGLDAYGGITLLGIYAAARLCRLYEIDKRVRMSWLLLSLPILWFLTGIGFGDYNSPFAFALACACFLVCLKIRLGQGVGAIVNFIAPSMFSVYLLHNTSMGFFYMRQLESCLFDHGLCAAFVYMTVASSVFIMAVIIDFVRRGVIAVAVQAGRRA